MLQAAWPTLQHPGPGASFAANSLNGDFRSALLDLKKAT